MVKGPGIVIGRKGTLGTVFLVHSDFWPHDTTLWVKDFHDNDPQFAYYFLKTMGFEQYDCGASNPTLNRNHIHGLPVLYPTLPVQRKIASLLSAYDDLIENNTRRIAVLEEMAQALYREWFVRFRFPGHENVPLVPSPLGDIPQGWHVHRLDEVCSGIVDSEHKTAPTQSDGNPCIRTPNIGKGYFLLSEVRRVSSETYALWTRRAIPQEGDLILAREAPVGNVAIIPSRLTPCLGQRTVLVQARRETISPHYLLRILLSDVSQNAFAAVSSGATVAHLNLKDLRGMMILVADQAVRVLVNPCFEAIDKQIACLLQRNELLRKTRDLLLPKLITGQLDVEHLDIDAGEPLTV